VSLVETPLPVTPRSSTDASDDPTPVIRIAPRSGWQIVDFRELYRFRELLFFLAWRDVAVRYKQTVLGVAWAFLQPLATMLVFALFLGRAGGFSSQVEHYPLYVLAGVLPWTFFANAITQGGNSLVANERLITRVYFPRLIVPLSCVGAAAFDFVISLLLLAGLMLGYGVFPGASVLLLPVLILLIAATAAGVAIFLSALIVSFRDFRYVLNFGVQLWMFATPAIYLPPDSLGPRGQWLAALNPAQGLLFNFRQALLDGELHWGTLVLSGGIGVSLLVLGCWYFRKVEQHFADVI
jgi:lipopolysaccharide transport system permease protein